MAEHKYPYIPKKYFKPVMFACKMIRENGYFNKAVQIAANYYGVDADEVAKHVRARQGAGQKGITRKYHTYGIVALHSFIYGPDLDTCDHWSYFEDDYKQNLVFLVKKATSEENAIKAMRELDDCDVSRGIPGDFYIPIYVTECKSETDANEALSALTWEQIKPWIESVLETTIRRRNA